MEEKNELELKELRAMVMLPENAVEVEIHCKVYMDGELVPVKKTLTLSDLRAAFDDADRNYMEDDDTFVLTEKCMEALERYEAKQVEEAWK